MENTATQAPIKKKKHHIVLWIVLILVFVIVILPIGLSFAFFFDPAHTTSEELGISTTGEKKPLTNNLVVDLFDHADDASKNNSLSLSISEKDINQSLYDNLLSVLDNNTKSIMPQAFLDIGKEDYTFTVELNAYGFFKTRLFIVTSLNISDNPKGLMFELKNLKVGRLGGLQNLLLGNLGNFIDDKKLEQELSKSMSFTLESHLVTPVDGKRYIFYPHDNFVSDMARMIKSGESSFFQDFILQMFSDRKFNFSFYEDKKISGLLSLQEFHDNANYCSNNDYVIDFEMKKEINQYLPTLINSGVVNENNVDIFSKYLSFGSSLLTSGEKDLINNASSLPSILGKSVAEYSSERETKFALKGKKLSEVNKIEDVVSAQVSNALTPTRCTELIASDGGDVVDARVDEFDLHDVLKTSSFIGYGKTMYYQQADGSYKIAFVTIDNMYMNIINNNIYFILGLNMNGYETSLIVSSIIQSAGNGKLYFKLDQNNAYFGSYKIPATLFDSLTSLFASSSTSSGWFSYDANKKSFLINFIDAINNNEQIKLLKASGLNIDVGVSAVGASIIDNGYINIYVSASRS